MHVYRQVEILREAVTSDLFTLEASYSSNQEDKAAAEYLKALARVEDLRAYAEACHRQAQSMLNAMSEEELVRPVESPFGTYPVWRYCEFAYDEHWHHRGQLYTYLRLLGKEPPMLYDY